MKSMKIAYLLHFNFEPSSGVYKKIRDEVKQLLKFGQEVRIFLVTRNDKLRRFLLESDFRDIIEIEMYPDKLNFHSLSKKLDTLYSLSKSSNAMRHIRNSILKWNPDIIYTRQDLYYSSITEIGKKKPLIIEINTYDLGELRILSKFRYIYNLLTRDKMLSTASGFVFVTYELSEMKAYKKFEKPYEVIGNGINLDEIQPIPVLPHNDITIVFLGQGKYPWYGIDKICYLAKCFPNWKFYLVGLEEQDLKGSERLPNVTCCGFLKCEQYINLLKIADCAIGTLALHRIGINEASPIKTREYLAFGLPVIIAYKDTDFPEEVDFILRLPNNQSNIEENLILIKEFVLKWKGKRVPRNNILHLGIERKLLKKLTFFESVLKRGE